MKIVLTNDDGPHSPALRSIVKLLSSQGHQVVVVVPEKQRSAAGFARTYHKPLRVRKVGDIYVTNGYPADAVFLALKLLAPDAELVLSGVNVGENIGFESTYGSGTIAAAVQAGVLGYKGVAVSMEDGAKWELVASALSALVDAAAGQWSKGLVAVSVNVPSCWSGAVESPKSLALGVFSEALHRGRDPRGEELYWRWGPRADAFPPDTDAYAFYVLRAITALGICPHGVCSVREIAEEIKRRLALPPDPHCGGS